jgi:hypothetical protein
MLATDEDIGHGVLVGEAGQSLRATPNFMNLCVCDLLMVLVLLMHSKLRKNLARIYNGYSR